ncbi:MAG TPA: ATP-binding protein [Acidimicrobiia bacterium]
MSRLRSLGARLFVSHLAVVAASSLTVLLITRLIAPGFYRDHLSSMTHMMGGEMTEAVRSQLETSFSSAFTQALIMSVLIGIAVAVVLALAGSRRVVRPINEVRRATRRLARGHYRDRVEIPSEEELAALAEDFNDLAAALAATDERRLRLLAEVSHELRTPLTTIEGYMEAILDGVLQPTPDIVASVAHEATRLKRLAADIALLSSAEEAGLALDRHAIDLVGLVSGVVARLRPQFAEAEVGISVQAPDRCEAVADPDRVTQIVTNLVGNALTYTPGGGSVTVSIRRDTSSAQISVIDTGLGVDADDAELIFERFHRVDRSAPGGMGVGLSIARSLARLHGGDVTLESDGVGRGSTFTLTLPIEG